MMGFETLAKVCHSLESVISHHRDNDQIISIESLTLQQKAFESIKHLLNTIEKNGEENSLCNNLADSICEDLSTQGKYDNTKKPEAKKESAHLISIPLSNTDILQKYSILKDLNEYGFAREEIENNDLFCIKLITNKDLKSIEESLISKYKIQVQIEEKAKTKIEIYKAKYKNDFSFISVNDSNIDCSKQNLYSIKIKYSQFINNASEKIYDLIHEINNELATIIYCNKNIYSLQKSINKAKQKTMSEILDKQSNTTKEDIYYLELLCFSPQSQNDLSLKLGYISESDKIEVKEIHHNEYSKYLNLQLKINESKPSEIDNKTSVRKTSFIRVNNNNLQKVLNQMEELIINQNKLSQEIYSSQDSSQRIKHQFNKIQKSTFDLQQKILDIRLIEVQYLFKRFEKYIYQVSKELNKRVKVNIKGGDNKIDKIINEELYESLLHLIRNAIDHGIESTYERKENNKAEEGSITFSAKSEINSLIIQISDDGRGLNYEKIKEKAIEQKIYTKETIQHISKEKLSELIFTPAFSTKSEDEISNISGRGVGLDVVHQKILSIGGQIKIKSEENKGTTFELILPSDILLIDCLVIPINGNSFAIPSSEVIEIYSLDNIENGYFDYRGNSVQLIDLSSALGFNSKLPDKVGIIINIQNKYYALSIDNIEGQKKLLSKPLLTKSNQEQVISGISITNTGEIVQIINPYKLISKLP